MFLFVCFWAALTLEFYEEHMKIGGDPVVVYVRLRIDESGRSLDRRVTKLNQLGKPGNDYKNAILQLCFP